MKNCVLLQAILFNGATSMVSVCLWPNISAYTVGQFLFKFDMEELY